LFIADWPVLLAFSLLFNVISYYLTGQPMELRRFLIIVSISVELCMVAQAWGLFASSMFGLEKTYMIAALFMNIHVALGGVLALKKDVPGWMQWNFELIFLKHANDGILEAILGLDREKLRCEDQIYCHFQEPKKFLTMIEAPDGFKAFYAIPIILFVIHTAAFMFMKRRLKTTN
jgi:hypothetical protein